ncbi:MAG: hypothetical protein ACJ8EY_08420 [Sphingomicrobium sp.]
MKRVKLAIACLLAATPISAVSAQDYAASALNDPAPAGLAAYGAQSSVVDDPKVPGGKAFRVTVAAKGANDWDAAVLAPLKQPVKKGDELVLAFWARVVTGPNGATTLTLPWNNVSLSSAPWTGVIGGPVTIGPDWKLYEVRGLADKDYAAGMLHASMQVATGKQTIDFGPVYVAKETSSGSSAAARPAAPIAKNGLAAIDPAKIPSMIINDPGNPTVNKARARLMDAPDVTGGKALRIQVSGKEKNPWDNNVSSAIKKAIKAGDNLLLVFWARLEQGANGATTGTLPGVGVNVLSPPWPGVLGGPADLTSEWKQFEIAGTAQKDYAPGEVGVSLQLGTTKQTVDLGPIILLDTGK